MLRLSLASSLVCLAFGCGDPMSGDSDSLDTDASESDASGSSGEAGSGDSESEGESGAGEETGEDTGPDVTEAELVRAEFTIPSGTMVLEFDFEAEGIEPPFDTTGALFVVSVLDLTHPDREQSEICPGNHPLDGCATVDYGAFGMTHDNRLFVENSEGSATQLHMYKDRSILPEAEPLPPNE